MKDGYFINFKIFRVVKIEEHEMYLRSENLSGLGIKPGILKRFDEFNSRIPLLLFVLQNSSLIRVRGYGDSITFEYSSRLIKSPIEAIKKFCKIYAGTFSKLKIVNFNKNEIIFIYYKDFLISTGKNRKLRMERFKKLKLI